MSRSRKYGNDGLPVPRRTRVDREEPDPEALAELEALSAGLPEPLRRLGELGLLGLGRRYRLEQALRHRTRSLVTVLHEVHDPHNQAAVVRSCEALGLLEMHLIEDARSVFQPSERITQSAHLWLETHRHPGYEEAMLALRARGLRIVATALRPQATPLYAMEFTKPTALFFGNECTGLPEALLEAADEVVFLPMYGLGQSLNISVSVGIAVSAAVEARRKAWGDPGDLEAQDPEDFARLRARMYRTAVHGRLPRALDQALEALARARGAGQNK